MDELFQLVDQRFKFQGIDLARARCRLNMNQSEFAYKCGWTAQYQWNLENNCYDSISESTRNVLCDTLNTSV